MEYDASTYGDRIAERYDTWFSFAAETEAAVEFLAGLAGDGRALELGIGTGRVALPLAARGVPVRGIDASARMVEQLRAKPGGRDLPVMIGDFADVAVDGTFALIYVANNTFFGLRTQEEQVRCFERVAEHLEPGGAFVIDAFAPDLTRFDRGQRVNVAGIDTSEVRLDVNMHDALQQQIVGHHVVLTERGAEFYPVQIRYAWPSELDLMARLAGLRLAERFGGWRREPFTAASTRHISVYRR